jgi:hypothetical protein
MIENNPSNVSSGFEMLLEEVEAEIDFFTRIGSRAFESRDFHRAMKPILKDVDHEPLASEPDMPRWRNSAQWARNTMRQEGLLKDDSPHGTWEITDAGRTRLAEEKQA